MRVMYESLKDNMFEHVIIARCCIEYVTWWSDVEPHLILIFQYFIFKFYCRIDICMYVLHVILHWITCEGYLWEISPVLCAAKWAKELGKSPPWEVGIPCARINPPRGFPTLGFPTPATKLALRWTKIYGSYSFEGTVEHLNLISQCVLKISSVNNAWLDFCMSTWKYVT